MAALIILNKYLRVSWSRFCCGHVCIVWVSVCVSKWLSTNMCVFPGAGKIHLRYFHISTERKVKGFWCSVCGSVSVCVRACMWVPNEQQVQHLLHNFTHRVPQEQPETSAHFFGNLSHSLFFVFLLFFCVRYAKKQTVHVSNTLLCLWHLVSLQLNSFFPRYSDCF